MSDTQIMGVILIIIGLAGIWLESQCKLQPLIGVIVQ